MFAGSVQSFSSWGIGRALLDNVDFSIILRIHCTKHLLSSCGASGPEPNWALPFTNAYGLVIRMARQYARCRELLKNSNALLLPAERNRSGRFDQRPHYYMRAAGDRRTTPRCNSHIATIWKGPQVPNVHPIIRRQQVQCRFMSRAKGVSLA